MKSPSKLDPNSIAIRDEAMVKLINGATKSGVHQDRRREANRKACRNKNWAKDY